MAIKHGWAERFHDDQLIVALPDLDVVTRELAHLGVRHDEPERSAVLGLALIRNLANVAPAVNAVQRNTTIGPDLLRFKEDRARARPSAPDVADLDLLIKGIHVQFAQTYPGWKVTIGKNYRPSPVKGYPHLGGGDGDPEPTEVALGQANSGRRPNSEQGSGVRVGLLDTRMYPSAWMAGRYIARPDDLLDRDQGTFTVFDGHCAFVGSCILQQAPAAEIHVRHVLDCHGDGTAWEAAVAMAEIARAGVDVVNLSFGEFRTDDNTAPMVFEAAVKRFSTETVVVAAAGNNGDVKNLRPELVHDGLKSNSASYPAALPDVVGVGALDKNGELAPFTPDPAPWISLLAPGVGLTGAYVRGIVNLQHTDKTGKVLDSKPVSFTGTAIWEGCSFAAGVVSGAIAARTVPGRRSARQALEELLQPYPGQPGPGQPGRGIRPYNPDS